jgi:hypothetical protein
MPFYQNPFEEDFRGNWILDDRQLSLTFKCPQNKNRTDLAVAWNLEPYDLSTFNTLKIYYALDRTDMTPRQPGTNPSIGSKAFVNWAALSINIAGSTPASTKAAEIMAILNANATFADHFTASLDTNVRGTNQPTMRVVLKTTKPKHAFRFYVDNSGAEQLLKFNKYAGIADLPAYFDRHTIANRFTYNDGAGLLIRLSQPITGATVANPSVVTSVGHGLTTGDVIYIDNSNSTPTIDGQRTVTVINADTFSVPVNVTTAGTRGEFLTTQNYNVVNDFGINPLVMKHDWEHLSGGSKTFMFTKNTIDGSNRVTQKIEYHAGSVAGDLAIKTIYTYSSTNTFPDSTFEIPYQLQTADLITPP